jgi:phosphoglycolate phosphatase-like HAD superfamily hydrolase
MRFKVIIFDFDGVLVESVDIKDLAFKRLFKQYPQHLDKIMDYHLSNNATIRFEKFRYITERILGKRYDEEAEKSLSNKFSSLVFKSLVDCPYVPGAKEILDCYWGKIPLYLASVSPADELDEVLEAKKLKRYFKRIYAVPWIKKEAIRDIINREDVSPKDIVFIGDSYEDFEAAQSTGIFFIGRNSGRSFHGARIQLFKDMFYIRDFLTESKNKKILDS